MKKIKICVLIIFIVVILTPISIYIVKFQHTFSGKNSDWGSFGSFVGGIYGAFFSGASLVILSITLYQAQKNHNEQISLIASEQKLNKYKALLEDLKSILDIKKYENSIFETEESFLDEMKKEILPNAFFDKEYDDDRIRDILFKFMYDRDITFQDEIGILLEIFNLIPHPDNEQYSLYLALLNNKINSGRRFMLSIYGEHSVPKFLQLMPDRTEFRKMPWCFSYAASDL